MTPYIKWQPIATAPKNKFILVACKSGYVTIDWIYRVARCDQDHPDRWDDEDNNALWDSGHEPEFWCELPNEPQL